MSAQKTNAIVIGGSMAGLLAARVLSDHYGTVTIIERDALPETPEYRHGTPQARHLHALLAHGQRILEDLFPDIEQDFNAQGETEVRWGLDTANYVIGGWIPHYDAELRSHVLSRTTLEWIVRQRVAAIHNVTFMTQQSVNHLLTNDDQSAVTGVNMTSRLDQNTQDLFADMVVDCSGRGSKAMQWLENMGYQAPQETVINSHLGYATRWYQLDKNMTYPWKMMFVYPQPKNGLARGGGMFIVEGNQLVITVTGANKDYPPTSEEGFLEFAKSLASPIMYDIIKDLTPISPVYGYRRTENRMRHYEKLSRMPQGLIVMGDAACGFNPLYGQGMTAAAIEAVELDHLLQKTDVHNLGDFSLQFQKQLAKSVSGAWLMATGEDLRYPETEGGSVNLIDRLTQRYMDMMIEVLVDDTVLCNAFIAAMNLNAHPVSLFHPKYVTRVIYHKLFAKNKQEAAQPTINLTATQTF